MTYFDGGRVGNAVTLLDIVYKDLLSLSKRDIDIKISCDDEMVSGKHFVSEYPAGVVLFQSYMFGAHCSPINLEKHQEFGLGGIQSNKFEELLKLSSLISLERSNVADKVSRLRNMVCKFGDYAF